MCPLPSDCTVSAGEVFVHGVKHKGPRSGSGASAGFEDGDVVGVMVGAASGRVALYRNGVLCWSVAPGVRPSLSVVPFVSLGAADLSAVIVGEPARVPPAPHDWTAGNSASRQAAAGSRSRGIDARGVSHN